MGGDDVTTILRMAGLATPMALRVAVTLGLPDRLRGAGAGVAELAGELGVAPVPLGQLLGHLTSLGFFERTATGYRTTEFGAHLCGDSLVTVLLDLGTAGGRAELAFVELLHSVTTGEPGYGRRYGRDFWADLAEHPHLRESFDRQMAHRLREQIPRLAAGYGWGRFATIADVGGGRGALLAAILAAHPGLRGKLVDLDPTASEAAATFAAYGVGDRAEAIAASFFDPLPAGADAYLLCDILHDWDDEHAHRILARCAEAARPDGRVLIVEPVGGRQAGTDMDLAMLVIFGGRERRVGEFEALASAHGMVLDAVTDLSGRSVLEFRFG
ncbi:methyltransferase [Amycolatopsis australiensis]|uniref:O-methyltransferase n=1 Tax=Amycolatopsis australiensis TaxID=546364 RepID=A0A1K1T6N6_9PSEU|nr:methyltransferase [Amycolatopsis australiensis]SFW92174.1 O-methyltransferase [Amycolatopsis australiensis]